MVVKYNNITSQILDCEFGLSGATQTQVPNPSNMQGFPEPTIDASSIDYHEQLGLISPVVVLGGWGFKSEIVSTLGLPVTINSGALFSFYNGIQLAGGTHYTTKWSFSQPVP